MLIVDYQGLNKAFSPIASAIPGIGKAIKEVQQAKGDLCAITVLLNVFFPKVIWESSQNNLHFGGLGSGMCLL